jgi:hypothetical protein
VVDIVDERICIQVPGPLEARSLKKPRSSPMVARIVSTCPAKLCDTFFAKADDFCVCSFIFRIFY